MAVGTTLATLRQMLNAECREEMDETISPASVVVNNQLLNNQQAFLFHEQNYLRGKTVVQLQAQVGQQYYPLPAGIDWDTLEKPEYTSVAGFRYHISYGIGQEEYNLFRSEIGVTASPVMRWDITNAPGQLQIELWPIPSVAQTIYFTGLLPLALMVQDTDTCVIDDLALVLYTAAEKLAGKAQADAQTKGTKAKAHSDALKAKFPFRYERFNLSGKIPSLRDFYKGNNRRPVVATNH